MRDKGTECEDKARRKESQLSHGRPARVYDGLVDLEMPPLLVPGPRRQLEANAASDPVALLAGPELTAGSAADSNDTEDPASSRQADSGPEDQRLLQNTRSSKNTEQGGPVR